jgi:two-component system NtrC family sensor kinase
MTGLNPRTGLGLSLSYDIIKAHQGEIIMEAGQGAFTRFLISLPIR